MNLLHLLINTVTNYFVHLSLPTEKDKIFKDFKIRKRVQKRKRKKFKEIKPFFTADCYFLLNLLTSLAGLRECLVFPKEPCFSVMGQPHGPITNKRWYS